jgi:NitT/TauT family transport system permease protein
VHTRFSHRITGHTGLVCVGPEHERHGRHCAAGATGAVGRGLGRFGSAVLPVLTVVACIIALWYAAAVGMNRAWTLDQMERRGLEMTQSQIIADAMNQERPVLPTPHQVGAELWATTMGEPILRERRGEYRPNPRSLFFHAWQTLAPTLLGFVIGGLAGILLAVGIVHNRAMDLSVMPWAIASQTIPILAIAPMIIVVLNSIGLEGLIPKSLISAYLSFFPVVVGMVKGLRSPGAMDLDLLRTYSASGGRPSGSCACRPRCRSSSPRSRWGSRRHWWAPSWRSCRPGRASASARGC